MLGRSRLHQRDRRVMASIPVPSNVSSASCSGDISRNSCFLTTAELGERDAIAAIRMIISCLSIIGAVSIIVSAMAKKQVCSPRVHPIFVLSVADFMLALLWVIGGAVWFRDAPSRVWCFAVTLPTVILECVTVNLTVLYALIAYSSIKKMDFNSFLVNLDQKVSEHVWSPLKTFIAYFLAWTIPVVIVMVAFAISATRDRVVADANICSCWCLPLLPNVLPFAIPRDEPTAVYKYHIAKLGTSFALILGTQYLLGFIVLVVLYYKILRCIRKMKTKHEQTRETSLYGATQALIVQGQSKARKRVVYFLVVFIFYGFFNFILSYWLVIYEISALSKGPQVITGRWLDPTTHEVFLVLYACQSVTVPVQGFANAIVYGWTREDFIYVMAINRKKEAETEKDVSEAGSDDLVHDNTRVRSPTDKDEHTFTHTLLTSEDDM